MTELSRVVPAVSERGATEAEWSWCSSLPIVVTLRADGCEAVLDRAALEDLLAQLDCGAEFALVRVGVVELSASTNANGLQVADAPDLPLVIADLQASWSFLAETWLWTPPCADDSCRPPCPQCRALSVWSDIASWRLLAGWSV